MIVSLEEVLEITVNKGQGEKKMAATKVHYPYYQAITTKYLGPTNYRGSRVVARTASGVRRIYSWASDLDETENHRVACHSLITELKWSGEWFGGSTRDGYVWVSRKDGKR